MSSGFSQNPNPQGGQPVTTPVLTGGIQPRAAEMKAPGAFRTISEVATDLEVPQHVLRFWESKFQQIRPLKRGGGRRYYRPEDVNLLNSIKDLLYNQGFTIRGVQKLLREGGKSPLARAASMDSSHPPSSMQALQVPAGQPTSRGLSADKRREVETVLGELKALREILRQGGI